MAQPSPSEFQPYRKVQSGAEKELTAILEATARSIQKRVAKLRPGVGGQVRAAQLRLTLSAIRKLQRSMWVGSVSPAIKGQIDAALQAGESAVEALTRVAYGALSERAAEELVRGLRLAAESGLKSDAARRKRELSERVYKLAALHEGKVEETIRTGLISNLSAKELAEDVYQYVSPTTKGGAAYGAMRLARTEINNAFHERQIAGATRPGVQAVQWNLSGSHKVPDLCNVYAEHEPFAPNKVPEKPHPQCFCFLTYVTMPDEDFREKLASGGFDDEIDRRTRENLARMGQPVGSVKVPEKEPTAVQASFITTRIRGGGGDSKFFAKDVARRFEISEDEAAQLIAYVKAKGVPTIKENKPEPTKARPSKVVQGIFPVKETPSKTVEPVKVDGDDPLNRVKGEGRDRVQRVLDEQRGYVPNAMRKFNGIRVLSATEAKDYERRFGKEALGGYTVETREIGIHPQVLTKKYEREFARDLKSGFFSKCGHDHGSVESFVAHECGHHVDNIMRLANPVEVRKVWKSVAAALGLTAPSLTDRVSLDRWVSKNQAVIAKKVSGYGSENAAELMAEVWAEYTTNSSPRAHVKVIGDALKELAEKTAR
jgi:hypothetical protein